MGDVSVDMDDSSIRQAICDAGKRLYQKNYLASADGNISFQVSEEKIWITPSACAKAFINPQDIALITRNNRIIFGVPSSERAMHLTVYRECSKAVAVVHAHPPHAVAWSVAHPNARALPRGVLPEVILGAGEIPIVPYGRPGTEGMGDVLKAFLPQHRLLILQRHGALSWGESLAEAVNGMERLAHVAETLMYAKLLGGVTELPDAEVEALYEMKKNRGETVL